MGSWIAPHEVFMEPCQVYGTIYITTSPGEADFVVYVESEEIFADLVVFKESNLSFADKEGSWFEVESPALADYIICLTTNISESDFTIAYTDSESFAGCNE